MFKRLLQLALIAFVCYRPLDTRVSPNNSPKIVLITLDGVRWQDIYGENSRALLPNFYHYLVDQGMAIGKESLALVGGPAHVSLPGYLEIMRGYPTFDCLNNECLDNVLPTIINHFPNNSAIIASWKTIKRTFDNSIAIVNTGKDYQNINWQKLNITESPIYSNEFWDNEYRPDRYTETLANQLLQIKQPNFLWVSLGDTDEFAHQNNKEEYLNSLKQMDIFFGNLIKYKLTDNNTVYIICPDHGRNDNFTDHGWEKESRRIWIMIGGSTIPNKGFIKYNRPVYLSDIKPTILDIVFGIKDEKSLLNN